MLTEPPPTDPWGARRARPTGDLLPDRPPRQLLHWSVVSPEVLIGTLLGVVGLAFLALFVAAVVDDDACVDAECRPSAPVGVGWTDGAEIAVIRFEPCGDELVRRVAVTTATGDVLWEVVADPGVRRTAFVMGQVGEPYTEVVPAVDPLPRGDLTATVEASGVYQRGFQRSNLFEGLMYYDGYAVPTEVFGETVRRNGGCPAWAPALRPGSAPLLQIGLLALAAVTAALLATRFFDRGSPT